MSDELFEMPILGAGRQKLSDYPFKAVRIPLSCEPQALENHGQTLSRLRARGGLTPEEICCIVDGRHWRNTKYTITETIERLKYFGVPR